MNSDNSFFDKAKKPTEKLLAVMESRQEKYSSWLRNIIAMAVAFLGISVSFQNQTTTHHIGSNPQLLYWFWNLQLLFLILGILFGTIRLFGDIRLLDDEKEIRVQNIIKRLHGQETQLSSVLKMKKVYLISEKICYISFLLALICVLALSFLKNY